MAESPFLVSCLLLVLDTASLLPTVSFAYHGRNNLSPPTMKKLLTCIALATVALSSAAFAQLDVHFITDTPGATSTSNWYVIVRTTNTGLIQDWVRSKDGARKEGDCEVTLSATDPGGKPDTVLTGKSDAGTWTIKMNFSSVNEITRIWGQNATGQFWIGKLVTRKIHPEYRPKARKGQKTPAKSIY